MLASGASPQGRGFELHSCQLASGELGVSESLDLNEQKTKKNGNASINICCLHVATEKHNVWTPEFISVTMLCDIDSEKYWLWISHFCKYWSHIKEQTVPHKFVSWIRSCKIPPSWVGKRKDLNLVVVGLNPAVGYLDTHTHKHTHTNHWPMPHFEIFTEGIAVA